MCKGRSPAWSRALASGSLCRSRTTTCNENNSLTQIVAGHVGHVTYECAWNVTIKAREVEHMPSSLWARPLCRSGTWRAPGGADSRGSRGTPASRPARAIRECLEGCTGLGTCKWDTDSECESQHLLLIEVGEKHALLRVERFAQRVVPVTGLSYAERTQLKIQRVWQEVYGYTKQQIWNK